MLPLALILALAAVPAADTLARPAADTVAAGPVRSNPAAESTAARDSAPAPLRLVSVATLATSAPGPAQVVEPGGVAVDAFGRVWVSDAALHRLQRFDADGTWRGVSGALGSDAGRLRRPGAVVPLGTLSVAVLDRENRRVLACDLFGRWLGTTADLASPELDAELGRVDPVDLAADRGGAFVVADADRDRLLVFDTSGRFLRTVGGVGARPGSFRGLRGVGIAPLGDLVTAERGGARVQRLDAGGRALAVWPLDVRPGGGALPVAVDDSLRTAVADEATGRLWVFGRDGARLAALEGLGSPRALAFAPDGTLLVAEAAGRVRRFALQARPAAGGE